jgi:hypothetical protein
MGWKNSSEMAAAMVLPVLPFLCLVWFHVTKGAQCGAYCATTVVAMLVLMRYRRSSTRCRCSNADARVMAMGRTRRSAAVGDPSGAADGSRG